MCFWIFEDSLGEPYNRLLLPILCTLIYIQQSILRLPKSNAFECGSDVSSGFITGGQEAPHPSEIANSMHIREFL